MTLCIAAPARLPIVGTPCIVLCFDAKISGDEFGSESEHKFHVLGDRMMALVAGKPGRAKELAIICREEIRRTPLTEDNVLEVFRRSLDRLKRRLAETYISRCLAVSYQEFLDHGERWFGKERFDRYLANIEANPLGVEMIFAGFIGENPTICQLRQGEIEMMTNFSLIGTGAYTAEPTLHARKHTNNTLVADAVYNVYEAKKSGENSPFVGHETRLYVLSPTKGEEKLKVLVLNEDGEKSLRKRFKKYGPKPTDPQLMPDSFFTGGFY